MPVRGTGLPAAGDLSVLEVPCGDVGAIYECMCSVLASESASGWQTDGASMSEKSDEAPRESYRVGMQRTSMGGV